LHGNLQILSYTDDINKTSDNKRIVKLEKNQTVLPEDSSWLLSPTIGNLHQFSTIDTCVIVDILLPPYKEPERPCNYYRVNPLEGVSNEINKLYNLDKLSEIEEKAIKLPYLVRYKGFKPIPKKSNNLRWK
jgi:hypothetical protein